MQKDDETSTSCRAQFKSEVGGQITWHDLLTSGNFLRQVHGCKRRHPTLLHPLVPCQPEPSDSRAKVAEAGIQVSDSPLQGGQTNNTSAGGGKVCLRIVPVKVRTHGASKTVKMYALLDSGSDISLCEKELAVELGVQGDQKMCHLTTQEREDSPKVGQEISLTVEALDGTDKILTVLKSTDYGQWIN